MRWLRSLVRWCSSLSSLAFSMALCGEAYQQGDLLVGKRTHFLPVQSERTDQFVLLQHRDSEKRPHAPKFDGPNPTGIAAVNVARQCCHIG